MRQMTSNQRYVTGRCEADELVVAQTNESTGDWELQKRNCP